MSQLYKTFTMDSDLEKDGIVVDYGDAKFTLARAGGQNHKFRKALSTRSKPYRHRIDKGLMDEESARRLMAETYAEAIVLAAKIKVGDKWVDDMLPSPDGKGVPFTFENCVQMLLDLPELFADIQNMSSTAANYSQKEDAEDEENLKKS